MHDHSLKLNCLLLSCADTGRDRRRYNAPSGAEVAAIMPGDGSDGGHGREIIFRPRGGGGQVNGTRGKLCMFTGDPKQLLPVVPHGSPAQIVADTLNRANFWGDIEILRLTINMRARLLEERASASLRLGSAGGAAALSIAADARGFDEFLKRVGTGDELTVRLEDGAEYVQIPERMALPPGSRTEAALIESVFGEARWDDPDWLVGRGILTPLCEDVDKLNDQILDAFPGDEVRTYLSADKAEATSEVHGGVPVEFLNRMCPSGMPPHKLRLKVGMPIMLLRNINKDGGQVNGTRAILRGMHPTTLDVQLATGPKKGSRVFWPRIDMTPSESDKSMPFQLKRRQFPIRPAFVMTIHKAQGQTLQFMGLFLPHPVFSHGMFYVAISRVGGYDRIVVLAYGPNNLANPDAMYTKNVVYKAVFRGF